MVTTGMLRDSSAYPALAVLLFHHGDFRLVKALQVVLAVCKYVLGVLSVLPWCCRNRCCNKLCEKRASGPSGLA